MALSVVSSKSDGERLYWNAAMVFLPKNVILASFSYLMISIQSKLN